MSSLTTTREFRWDDPGAPVLNGEIGSFYGLMKTCLGGTGVAYGTGEDERHKAGWSIEWDDPGSQTIVLRNSLAHGGSGCYLRVQDDGSGAGGARVARVDVYESMSDIDTGSHHVQGGWVWKALTATADPRAYTLHADERTLYGTMWVRNATPDSGERRIHTAAFGLGDYVPTIAGDPAIFAAVGGTGTPSTTNSAQVESPIFAGGLSGTNNIALSRDGNLLSARTWAYIMIPSTSSAGLAVGGAQMPFGNTPLQIGRNHYIPAYLADNTLPRGRLRGLAAPINSYATGPWVGVGSTVALPDSGRTLAVLAGNRSGGNNDSFIGRLFVERALSWDDI